MEVGTSPAGVDRAPTWTGMWDQPHAAACHWLTWLGLLCQPPVSAVELTETCTDPARLQTGAQGLVTNPKQLPFPTQLPPAPVPAVRMGGDGSAAVRQPEL